MIEVRQKESSDGIVAADKLYSMSSREFLRDTPGRREALLTPALRPMFFSTQL
jgi:hypothetical protein